MLIVFKTGKVKKVNPEKQDYIINEQGIRIRSLLTDDITSYSWDSIRSIERNDKRKKCKECFNGSKFECICECKDNKCQHFDVHMCDFCKIHNYYKPNYI